MSITGGDKFMDGHETFQYSPRSQPEVSRVVNGITDRLTELREELKQKFQQVDQANSTNAENAAKAESIAKRGLDTAMDCQDSMKFMCDVLYPLVIMLLTSKVARFINWFCKWYCIHIYPSHTYAYVDGKKVIKRAVYYMMFSPAETKTQWYHFHEIYKDRRKEMKENDYTLKHAVATTLQLMKLKEIRL